MKYTSYIPLKITENAFLPKCARSWNKNVTANKSIEKSWLPYALKLNAAFSLCPLIQKVNGFEYSAGKTN